MKKPKKHRKTKVSKKRPGRRHAQLIPRSKTVAPIGTSALSPEVSKGLARTTTGEIYQPIRVHYKVTDMEKVVNVLKKLHCMDFDASEQRWVWLSTAEAERLEFEKPPSFDNPLVLGSFFLKAKTEMVIDLKSIERALLAIEFFDQHIPRTAARVTDVSVVNRLFSFSEAMALPTNHDHFFSTDDVSILNPQEALNTLEAVSSKAQDLEKKAALVFDFLQSESKKPFPELERFPSHFYEDGIIPLKFTLKSRQMVAIQHWQGNTQYTYSDFAREIVHSQAVDDNEK